MFTNVAKCKRKVTENSDATFSSISNVPLLYVSNFGNREPPITVKM